MSIENSVSIAIAALGFFAVMIWVWRGTRGNTR